MLRKLVAALRGVGSAVLLLGAVVAGALFGQTEMPSSFNQLREMLLGFPSQCLVIAPFFFLVGLELRREIHDGALRPIRNGVGPALGAILGVALPALWFWSITAGTVYAGGWPIPTATDVTFALAVYVAFGSTLPRAARTFLLTFAVIDDVIAVLLITLVFGFSADSGFAELLPLAFAFIVPLRWPTRIEANLLRYLNWVGLPIFAFLMVAVPLPSIWVVAGNVVFWAIVARPLWKFVGIFIGGLIGGFAVPKANRLRTGDLAAVAGLGGIGFTVSLLVAGIAYSNQLEAYSAAVVATFSASLISAVAGAILLVRRHSA